MVVIGGERDEFFSVLFSDDGRSYLYCKCSFILRKMTTLCSFLYCKCSSFLRRSENRVVHINMRITVMGEEDDVYFQLKL